MIFEACMELVRKQGYESLNTRSIAHQIHCSTQPIYSRFATMEELKQALYIHVGNYFNTYVSNVAQGKDFFKQIGIAYITFAKEESNLFKFLFMSEFWALKDFSDMFSEEENQQVAYALSQGLKITLEDAKNLYMKIWIFTHGIASMVATKSIALNEKEISSMLAQVFSAFLQYTKNNTN